MNSHKHARLTPRGRALLVGRVLDESWSVGAASEAPGVSKRTGFKCLARFRSEGATGLADRSSRPLRSPRPLDEQEQAELERMWRMRWPLWRIAERCGRGIATVSRSMKGPGLSRLKSLERYSSSACYSLIVSLRTERTGVDLHNVIANKIAIETDEAPRTT